MQIIVLIIGVTVQSTPQARIVTREHVPTMERCAELIMEDWNKRKPEQREAVTYSCVVMKAAS